MILADEEFQNVCILIAQNPASLWSVIPEIPLRKNTYKNYGYPDGNLSVDQNCDDILQQGDLLGASMSLHTQI